MGTRVVVAVAPRIPFQPENADQLFATLASTVGTSSQSVVWIGGSLVPRPRGRPGNEARIGGSLVPRPRGRPENEARIGGSYYTQN